MSPLLPTPSPSTDVVAAHRYAEPTVVEVLPAWRRDPAAAQGTRNVSADALTSLPRKSRPYAVAA